MSQAEVEKIADNRYRIRAHDHVLTVSAQDLCDLFDFLLKGHRIDNLKAEARNAALAENRAKPWLPIQPGEEF